MNRYLKRTFLLTAAAVTAVSLVAAVPAGAAESYGRNDSGGFRNVLPPGQHGVNNASDLLNFLTKGQFPGHWADQQKLYEDLMYASPTLTNSQIGDYFKDATFGVKADEVESVVRPRKGLTILRDKSFGVPHVYGKTRSATLFGAGYAGAQDRLFLMDVLRHTGRAQLSSFIGGSNLAADVDQWKFAAYTEADLQRQLTSAPKLYGKKAGRRMIADVNSYVAGVNAYIEAARQDPSLMPVEYGLLSRKLEAWKPTDVIATATLVGGIFGKGGGREVDAALILRALEQRFGVTHGRRIWTGLRSQNDAEAPVTAPGSFPYLTGSPFARRGLALPDRGSVVKAEIVSQQQAESSHLVEPTTAESFDAAEIPNMSGFGDYFRESLVRNHASNWELVSARESANGHPLAVMGPQTDYLLPQILVEMDLHGPGIDARGVAFPGVNLYVLMGHGRDYAWSATSAGSDNTDTFGEVLCGGDRYHYVYRGKCRAMQKLVRTNAWQPNVVDPTPGGSATLTVYRTVHGLVSSYGRVHGRRVAFAVSRSTYFHEGASVLGFAALNDPKAVRGPKSFQRAVSKVNFTFNWAYTDDQNIAYYLSGAYPKRARGTSSTLPVLGTGRYDWLGWNPKTRTSRIIPFAQHPRAINPPAMVSWNNKPAKRWSAADDQWGYGPIYRSQLISDKVRAGTRGRNTMTLAELVQAMAESATQDIRFLKLFPILKRAVGTTSDPKLADAMAKLQAWYDAGSHRRDLDKDGVYEHNDAIQIFDAWWPKMVDGIFRPSLGDAAYDALNAMMKPGAEVGETPWAWQLSDGWWGYVSKDLRGLFAPKSVKGRYATTLCGKGKPGACRETMQAALAAALTVTPREMYGIGVCANNPQASCYNANRYRVTSAIRQPAVFPWQNRPTFQQVVSVRRSVR